LKAVVIGGGLAGAEAALQLAKRNISVDLYEMRPEKSTGAHTTDLFAELVCSNSLGSNDVGVASGLLKQELRLLGSFLINLADECKVPAGNALAVDRELFGQKVTELIEKTPLINVIKTEAKSIPENCACVIASGPLTSDDLSKNIAVFTGMDNLHFFDAVAPIVEKDSINFEKAFYASRYDKGEASYINCPMNEEEYKNFYNILTNAPRIELKNFEKAAFFESCLPVEVLASRGIDTLRFGPLKPVGLINPHTDKEAYATVQLRQDNMAATLYNMVGFQTNLKWGAQKELVQSIPGLENANIVRYGVMHRNTFIFSPSVLTPCLQTKKRNDLFFAGQITGVEGYTESIATGLLAGVNLANYLNGQTLLELPDITMLGALCKYITFEQHTKLNPINSNWGILAGMDMDKKVRKNKKLKHEMLATRSVEYLNQFAVN
jgi:methylenetetrahydrofolate--tRNA-(uracil-5-)-methyltransferase